MKRSLIFIVLLLSCITLSAQQKLSFSVLEFEQDVFDTSAKSAEYGKKDGNGSWYAIIKVTSNNPDDDITACQFNFGNMASKVEKHDEALWVYVQRNAKRVTISRPGYHTISQYDLQTTIEAGVNYKLVLTSDCNQQQLFIRCHPASAVVLIDGKMVDLNDGNAKLSLEFGSHKYSVLAKGYYQQDGTVEIEKETPTNLVVELVENAKSTINRVSIDSPPSLPKDEKEMLPNGTYVYNSKELEPLFYALSNSCGIRWGETIDELHNRMGGKMKNLLGMYEFLELDKGIEISYNDKRIVTGIDFLPKTITRKRIFPLYEEHLTWTSSIEQWEQYFKRCKVRVATRNEYSIMTNWYKNENAIYRITIKRSSAASRAEISLQYNEIYNN